LGNNFLQVHATVSQSTIYGPGERFVIWVQGCTLGCPGCWNIETWKKNGGQQRPVQELVEEYEQTGPHEGITILGGEPLQQSEACLSLINEVQARNGSVVLYTGYEPHEFNESMQSCFDSSDIIITGRYVQELRNTNLRWRGSSNQIIHLNSDRYADLDIDEHNEVEIEIDHDTGLVQVLGYPTLELLEKMENELGIEVLGTRAPRLKKSEET
jgi:anaerobic ribonucleoside-triphosphate reductase activating protein